MSTKFCPIDHYYLIMDTSEGKLVYTCRNCGYSKEDTEGGLVMETTIQTSGLDNAKVLLNEYTRQDPTLPHVQNIPCPNSACGSRNGSAKPDVIIIKTDPVGLKFLYICTICDRQWRSRD